MSIEFRCTSCGTLLRTGDDTAGKQAKCPNCGQILPVPTPGAPSAGPTSVGPTVPPPPGIPPVSNNPYQSPGDYSAGMQSIGGPPGTFAPTQIVLDDVFARAWAIYKDRLWSCVLIIAVLLGVNWGLSIATNLGVSLVERAFRHDTAIRVTTTVVLQVGVSAIGVWLAVAQTLIFLKIARGQPADLGEVAQVGPYFVRALLAGLIIACAVGIGTMLCIVPGVILALMLSQTYFLIVDRDVGVLDSLRLSMEITNGNKLTLFGIYLIGGIIGGLGILACGVGIVFTLAFMQLLFAVTYVVMTGQATADQTQSFSASSGQAMR